MRKTIEILLLVLTVLLFVTAFVSCKKQQARAQESVAKLLSGNFSCTAVVNYQGQSYTVQFTKPSADACKLAFTKPADLSSLSFELSGSGLTVAYDGLQASVDPSSIPQTAVISALMDTFDTAAGVSGKVHASVSGQEITMKGTAPAGDFTLTFTRDLKPQKLIIPAQKLEVTFSNFSYL
jgi:hypothetical protein